MSHLKLQPEDENARLAYADWLAENGDEAEGVRQRQMSRGYRAIVGLKKRPWGHLPSVEEYDWFRYEMDFDDDCDLPSDWFDFLESEITESSRGRSWMTYRSREEAMDAAALAFGMLPVSRQDEILNIIEVS